MKVLVKGLPASPGQVRGKAHVVQSSDDALSLENGEILVTLITDPTMFIEIIDHAAAIVTDLGGLGSHPAIVARELGLPCVVGTGNATSVIKTGMEIIVDGTSGVVYEPH